MSIYATAHKNDNTLQRIRGSYTAGRIEALTGVISDAAPRMPPCWPLPPMMTIMMIMAIIGMIGTAAMAAATDLLACAVYTF